MANLEVVLGGMRMKNPIGVAALNPAIAYARIPVVQVDWLMRHVQAGAGYVYISATRPQRSSPAEAKPALSPVPIKGSDGVPVIDKVNCQACGYCMAICPSGALFIGEG